MECVDRALAGVFQTLGDVRGLLDRGRTLSKQAKILSGLNYDERPVRYESIPVAHQNTFQWAFQDLQENSEKPEHTDARLMTWLREGSGTFWVSGKPGSGKSTFMKFLADSPNTASALRSWASKKAIVIATHFFWSAGNAIQKSDEGLLRSILFNVLDQCPDLIPKVLQQMWARAGANQEPYQRPSSSPSLTRSELETAINTLKTQLDLPVRFCFFIDGLDEYSGDHYILCQLLKGLSRAPGIKICVSSRPWNVFEESFGTILPNKIYIHELTRKDIRSYAHSELGEEWQWSVSGLESERPWIVDQITERAEGVFLWVFLVARQLRDGLINHDTASDLRKRLDEIPTDLGEFFKQILSSVDTFYHEMMARTLQVALAAEGALPTIVYALIDLEYENEGYYMDDHRHNWSSQKVTDLTGHFSRRLDSRCRGLLEVKGNEVWFLHITVADFLRTAEMENFIEGHVKRKFNPFLSIFQAYASWIVRDYVDINKTTTNWTNNTLPVALRYAGYAFDDDRSTLSVVCDRLDRMESSTPLSLAPTHLAGLWALRFRNAVLKSELTTYLSVKLTQQPHYFERGYCEVYRPPLQEILLLPFQYPWTSKRARLLECLLSNGHNPNRLAVGLKISPWAMYVERTIRARALRLATNTESKDRGFALVSAFKQGALLTLLNYGADPNPPGSDIFTLEPWECVLVFVFDMRHPGLADCANSVASVFDIMLSAANPNSLCPCRMENNRWTENGEACNKLHVGSHIETETRSTSAWRYICKRLKDMNARQENHSFQPLTHSYLGLLAEILRIYITKAYHSFPQLGDVVPYLEVFPLDLRNLILNAIGSTHPALVEGVGMLSVSQRGTPGLPSATRQSPIPLTQVASSQPMLQVQDLQAGFMPGRMTNDMTYGGAVNPWQQQYNPWQQVAPQWPYQSVQVSAAGVVANLPPVSPFLFPGAHSLVQHQQGWARAQAIVNTYGYSESRVPVTASDLVVAVAEVEVEVEEAFISPLLLTSHHNNHHTSQHNHHHSSYNG